MIISISCSSVITRLLKPKSGNYDTNNTTNTNTNTLYRHVGSNHEEPPSAGGSWLWIREYGYHQEPGELEARTRIPEASETPPRRKEVQVEVPIQRCTNTFVEGILQE